MACSNPWRKKINGSIVNIPCGWCMSCRIDKRSAWADRLMFECIGKRNTFVTLTYDDEHLPENQSLRQADTRKFIERYRIARKRAGDKSKWKFYLVGEYGGMFDRPHYHMIMTNTDCIKECDRLEELWGMGRIRAEPIKGNGAITYTLKYIDKQIHGKEAEEIYDKQGLERPFATMSKGIGKEYMVKHIEEMRELNGYYFKGSIRPLPTYYRNLLRIGEESNQNKKIRKAKENGLSYTEYLIAIGKLKEMHIIREMRNKNIPVEERYLTNYRPREEYIAIAKQLTQDIDLTPTKREQYIYDLFGGKYENNNLRA